MSKKDNSQKSNQPCFDTELPVIINNPFSKEDIDLTKKLVKLLIKLDKDNE